MPFQLLPLPYSANALDPVISSQTIAAHYGTHHKTYVENLNALVGDGPFATMPIEDVVRATAGRDNSVGLFNNAGQVLNHDLYWASLTPNGGGDPTGLLKAHIESDLGGIAAFRTAFHAAALSQFGSGWAWLVWKTRTRTLAIETTADADTPVVRGDVPLLALDVWEHAYYLDHQARRAAYATAVIDKLLNWNGAADRLAEAKG